MNILRGLGTAILSFLLFLSLTVFGMAYLVHSTVLNPDFVAAQVDRIEVSELARDLAEDMISEELPEEAQFLQNAVFDVIDDQEPWLKEQFNDTIYTSYDFFLDKSDTLEITIQMEDLKAGLRESLWEALNEQVATWLPEIVGEELSPYVAEHLEDYLQLIPDGLLPFDINELPKEQLLEFLDMYLQDIDQQITQEGLMPQVTGLLEVLLKPYYDDYFDEFLEVIPSEIVWDEETISADAMEQLLEVKKYIGYFQTGYYALIAIMVVLAAGIFLVNWNIGKSAVSLSISLLIYGVLQLASVLFAKSFNVGDYLPSETASMGPWLTTLINDVLSIIQVYSIVIVVIGVILLVVGIIFKRRASGETSD